MFYEIYLRYDEAGAVKLFPIPLILTNYPGYQGKLLGIIACYGLGCLKL